ncbi:MAG: molybdenum cofactor biosynthesis protein MoaE [Candidatus Marithrix sp.]|nr:molybdenum cofactor biosynthesis protein MoaE [Candidatus Marithrix sp.]
MLVKITPNEFNPWKYLQNHELQSGKFGATATFIGTMRDYNAGDTVKSMFLEYYPKMTEKYLQQISETALQRWDILDTLIIHRVGEILPGDDIVLVAVWAGHRTPAFAACRFLIEELKAKAPFWKRETLVDDDIRWVKNIRT